MVAVIDQDEVLLYGQRYKLASPVQRTLLAAFAPKIVSGDATRDDQLIASSWVQSDFSGGFGVERAPFRDGRYYAGDLDTRFPQQLSLAPLVTKRSTTTNITKFVVYGTTLYAARNTAVLSWNEGTQAFATAKTFSSTVSDLRVVRGDTLRLYAALSGTTSQFFNGSSWNSKQVATGTPNNPSLQLLADYQSLLCGLDPNGTVFFFVPSTDDNTRSGTIKDTWGQRNVTNTWQISTGTNGTASVVFYNLIASDILSLLAFPDDSGASLLCVVTAKGVWRYAVGSEPDNWYRTALRWPSTPNVGEPTVWNGALYVPVGQDIYRWDGNTVTTVGPNQEDGLPGDITGNISHIVSGQSQLYALVDKGSDTDSRAALLVSTGTAWHRLYTFPSSVTTITAAHAVMAATSHYRLWIATNDGVYTLDLAMPVLNPTKNPTRAFQSSGSLTTTWFDASWSTLSKLALSLEVVASQITGTEQISVFAQWDDDADFSLVGTVAANDKTIFPLKLTGERSGISFRKVRLRLDFSRDPNDSSKTPLLESVELVYVKRPKPYWNIQFVVDLTQKHKGRTPRQQYDDLMSIFDADTAGLLLYHPDDSPTTLAAQTVLPAQAVGSELTGNTVKGRYTISVVQLLNQTRT